MNASQVLERAREEFVKIGKKPADGVTGLSKTDGGWSISLEALERKAIPDTMDVLGLYELRLDDEGNLLGLDRKKLRKRGETHEE
jgi:hypothetical protein